MSIIIKNIEPKDREQLMPLAKQCFSESYYRDSEPNFDYMEKIIARSDGNKQFFGVKCLDDDKIVGFFFAHITTIGFCNLRIGMDDGFYITPSHRDKNAACVMMDLFKQWCVANGARPAVLIHYGDNNDAVYQLCQKMGLAERGRFFLGE